MDRRPRRRSAALFADWVAEQRVAIERLQQTTAEFADDERLAARIEQVRDVMVKNGDADKRVWLLEFGWTADKVHPDFSWFAVSEEKKAQNIVKAFQYARQNWAPWIVNRSPPWRGWPPTPASPANGRDTA